ncbi:MAG: sugar phosphate isomerase/epimerase [Planctomycetota bacterium]
MKYGMNLLLWGGEVTDEMLPTIEKLKEFGYDGVELPMFNLDLDYGKLGQQLKDLGLECTAVTVRNLEDNPISEDAAVRAKGIELTKKTLDCCSAVGAQTLCGPYHSALGHFSGAGPTADEWAWGVESMKAVAEHAGSVGVNLGVEALNRFECYFLNAHADAAKFAREVDHPACSIMYDTFHSNIEEKDIVGTLDEIKDKLIHIHISENDRSTPGAGNVNWEKNFSGIGKIGYDGWMVIEAFGLALPELAAATRIWRRMYDTELGLAEQGLAFMKEQVAKHCS